MQLELDKLFKPDQKAFVANMLGVSLKDSNVTDLLQYFKLMK